MDLLIKDRRVLKGILNGTLCATFYHTFPLVIKLFSPTAKLRVNFSEGIFWLGGTCLKKTSTLE